jgi:hypothetical protein
VLKDGTRLGERLRQQRSNLIFMIEQFFGLSGDYHWCTVNYILPNGLLVGSSEPIARGPRSGARTLKGTGGGRTGPATDLIQGGLHAARSRDLFPMHDQASACLMKLKAQCLMAAGIIDCTQKLAIDARAKRFLIGSPSDTRAVAQSARGIKGRERSPPDGDRAGSMQYIKFVLVNGRTPHAQSFCGSCGEPIGESYVRALATRLAYCNRKCCLAHGKVAVRAAQNHARAS